MAVTFFSFASCHMTEIKKLVNECVSHSSYESSCIVTMAEWERFSMKKKPFFIVTKSHWYHMVSISPTFYGKLLWVKIPKALKNTVKLSVFFSLLGSTLTKASNKLLIKFTHGQHRWASCGIFICGFVHSHMFN